LAILSEISGTVRYEEVKKNRQVVVFNKETNEEKSYPITYGSRIRVTEGQEIEVGDEITEGSVNPHDILKVKSAVDVQAYLIHEVQRVYKMQGVDINDKHIEIIVRQMMKKVKIEDSGDTDLLLGSLVDILDVEASNDVIRQRQANGEDVKEAQYSSVILGITKASLATDSFLSAASFQETTRVLTEAAIKGKIDPLIGSRRML
jgi:DNA-directed RNA polymerase subunit beta'